MNIIQKCDCCLKASVCKYKNDYQYDCRRLKQFIQSSPIEISVKCREFVAHQTNIKEQKMESG